MSGQRTRWPFRPEELHAGKSRGPQGEGIRPGTPVVHSRHANNCPRRDRKGGAHLAEFRAIPCPTEVACLALAKIPVLGREGRQRWTRQIRDLKSRIEPYEPFRSHPPVKVKILVDRQFLVPSAGPHKLLGPERSQVDCVRGSGNGGPPVSGSSHPPPVVHRTGDPKAGGRRPASCSLPASDDRHLGVSIECGVTRTDVVGGNSAAGIDAADDRAYRLAKPSVEVCGS